MSSNGHTMSRRITTLVIAFAFVVAACGGGSDSTSSGRTKNSALCYVDQAAKDLAVSAANLALGNARGLPLVVNSDVILEESFGGYRLPALRHRRHGFIGPMPALRSGIVKDNDSTTTDAPTTTAAVASEPPVESDPTTTVADTANMTPDPVVALAEEQALLDAEAMEICEVATTTTPSDPESNTTVEPELTTTVNSNVRILECSLTVDFENWNDGGGRWSADIKACQEATLTLYYQINSQNYRDTINGNEATFVGAEGIDRFVLDVAINGVVILDNVSFDYYGNDDSSSFTVDYMVQEPVTTTTTEAPTMVNEEGACDVRVEFFADKSPMMQIFACDEATRITATDRDVSGVVEGSSGSFGLSADTTTVLVEVEINDTVVFSQSFDVNDGQSDESGDDRSVLCSEAPTLDVTTDQNTVTVTIETLCDAEGLRFEADVRVDGALRSHSDYSNSFIFNVPNGQYSVSGAYLTDGWYSLWGVVEVTVNGDSNFESGPIISLRELKPIAGEPFTIVADVGASNIVSNCNQFYIGVWDSLTIGEVYWVEGPSENEFDGETISFDWLALDAGVYKVGLNVCDGGWNNWHEFEFTVSEPASDVSTTTTEAENTTTTTTNIIRDAIITQEVNTQSVVIEPPSPPSYNAVRNLTATTDSDGIITLNWDAPTPTATPIYGYEFLYNEFDSGGNIVGFYAFWQWSNIFRQSWSPKYGNFDVRAMTGGCVGAPGPCYRGPSSVINVTPVATTTVPTTTTTTTTTVPATTTTTTTTVPATNTTVRATTTVPATTTTTTVAAATATTAPAATATTVAPEIVWPAGVVIPVADAPQSTVAVDQVAALVIRTDVEEVSCSQQCLEDLLVKAGLPDGQLFIRITDDSGAGTWTWVNPKVEKTKITVGSGTRFEAVVRSESTRLTTKMGANIKREGTYLDSIPKVVMTPGGSSGSGFPWWWLVLAILLVSGLVTFVRNREQEQS